ncbi:cysteine hydrolase [Pseudomonas silvicola]|nr:cysteine hydrolase [Pseudomonas silvicola]
MTTQALLLIDLQNDYFPDGAWPLVGIEAASANAVRLLAAYREAGHLVVHVRHESPAADAPFFRAGSLGAELHASVLPAPGEPVILKHYPNAFRDTELRAVLDQHGVDSLVLAGAMSHMCIEAAGRAAADLGYATTVVHDASATRDLAFEGRTVPAAQVHAAAMAALAFGYARVIDTGSLLADG